MNYFQFIIRISKPTGNIQIFSYLIELTICFIVFLHNPRQNRTVLYVLQRTNLTNYYSLKFIDGYTIYLSLEATQKCP